MFIIVTEKGFLTGKKKDEILESDEIVFETQNPNWSDIIHGKRKVYENINNNPTNPTNNDRVLTTTTTEDNRR